LNQDLQSGVVERAEQQELEAAKGFLTDVYQVQDLEDDIIKLERDIIHE
jgi:hypothetical protein